VTQFEAPKLMKSAKCGGVSFVTHCLFKKEWHSHEMGFVVALFLSLMFVVPGQVRAQLKTDYAKMGQCQLPKKPKTELGNPATLNFDGVLGSASCPKSAHTVQPQKVCNCDATSVHEPQHLPTSNGKAILSCGC
jgi:hypothetical protein